MPATVVFDGDCLFCQRSVRFIHRHDRRDRFRFAARQAAAGTRLLAEAGVGLAPNSMVLLDEEGTWLRSDAVLRIAVQLGRPWSAAGVLLLVPRPLRDAAYRVVAAIRHRISGMLPACELPDAALRAKILE
ncbi:membrane protein [Luteitalea sp. TBR-22]|uniref:thiol-disulfide oxidoreductase DCC family protein n=1 Tax=Luteitalea sp. TBR-22 TaxID=2802971 RepID=UPI001AF60065|nr:DCC1-like thiol-disulfide oxidoreductase family protein [Luteitalea sp. TBR-22]BCS33149.1 membrane protein [Luteitalea sp. TBR-22]